MVDLLAAAKDAEPMPAELPPLTDETLREYTFTVTESTETVADGVTRAIWTYNGTSPGPTLHGRVGDTFRITLGQRGHHGPLDRLPRGRAGARRPDAHHRAWRIARV